MFIKRAAELADRALDAVLTDNPLRERINNAMGELAMIPPEQLGQLDAETQEALRDAGNDELPLVERARALRQCISGILEEWGREREEWERENQ